MSTRLRVITARRAVFVLAATAVVATVAVNEARTAEVRHQQLAADRYGRELDAELDAAIARRNAKRVVAADLAAGRITLAHAADRFLALDDGPGSAEVRCLRQWFPAPTARASEARCAIGLALLAVADPADRDRVAARLHADLERLEGEASAPQ